MRAITASLHVLEIPFTDPLRAFRSFADDPVVAFFDSATDSAGQGRYSYIAIDPFRILRTEFSETTNPFDALDQELSKYNLPRHPNLPPFQTGAAGVLSYEAGRHVEKLPAPATQGQDFPEMVIGLYDTVAAFDMKERKAWVLASDVADGDVKLLNRLPPEVRAQNMAQKISAAPTMSDPDWTISGIWHPEFSREDYEAALGQVIEYIHAGDIFQANLTQRFLGTLPENLTPFMLYQRLRNLSPAPFAAYLSCGPDEAVLSASPELFLSLDDAGQVATRPIKGTRPRGETEAEDAVLKGVLQNSEKDRAENLMIVDLLRNDLSRVCDVGSVRVGHLYSLETFATVHHLVSEIYGRLRAGLGPVDLLRATFPGGSITGAPKIRAMEIINELEPAHRGPYCGTIVRIGFDGSMDSSIVIRTLTIKDKSVVAQAGGGIVADSSPAAEYEESFTKVAPLLRALDPKAQP
jgi:para-aminobenzoate synthetase component I